MENKYLYEDKNEIDNFNPKAIVAICFLECQGKFLLLKRAKPVFGEYLWGVPGGKQESENNIRETISRELDEETGIKIGSSVFNYIGERYARVAPWGDYILVIFYLNLPIVSNIILSNEHTTYEWVDKNDLKSFNLLKGQSEAFDLV